MAPCVVGAALRMLRAQVLDGSVPSLGLLAPANPPEHLPALCASNLGTRCASWLITICRAQVFLQPPRAGCEAHLAALGSRLGIGRAKPRQGLQLSTSEGKSPKSIQTEAGRLHQVFMAFGEPLQAAPSPRRGVIAALINAVITVSGSASTSAVEG